MKKFILIDHSIKDAGGHHLEYALRTLKAAKLQGFYTVLATNKSCEHLVSEHIDLVDKAFSNTFWENIQSENLNTASRRWSTRTVFLSIKNQIKNFFVNSNIGFAYKVAAGGITTQDAFRRYAATTSNERLSVGNIITGYSIFKIISVCVKFSKLSILRRVKRVLTFFIHLFALLFSFLIGPFLLFRKIMHMLRPDRYIQTFKTDIIYLLKRLNAASGDIIFIPTLGNVELVACAQCADIVNFQKLSWHFLFRRNIFNGREPSYQQQVDGQFNTIRAFNFCRSVMDKKNYDFRFYTDTDGLTAQYNKLSILDFTTLPIPLDDSLCHDKKVNGARLNIGYIGDARDEKGFPRLARLVPDMVAAGLSEDEVKYSFQANFNVPGGETDSRIAKAELMSEPKGLVSLFDGPFESQEYTKLVNSVDLLLIPYDPYPYYARSSGIFAEGMAASIPFVASDKSWMANEMCDLNTRYYDNLLSTYPKLQSISLRKLNHHSKFIFRPETKNENVWLLVEVKQKITKPGEYLTVRWKTSPDTLIGLDKDKFFFREALVNLRSENSFTLMRLPKHERILLDVVVDNGLGNFVPLSHSNTFGMEIRLHELKVENSLPLFVGGAFYACEEDFGAAVMEVVTNYDTYLEGIKEPSRKWKTFHNANTIITQIAS